MSLTLPGNGIAGSVVDFGPSSPRGQDRVQADKMKAPSGNPRARGCENRARKSEKEIASAREKGRERERRGEIATGQYVRGAAHS